MKKHVLVVALLAATSLALGAAENPSPSASPSVSPDGGGPRCQASSWYPELYGFYGKDKQIVIDKLAKIPTPISEHRLVVQITQGNAGDVRLFEQQKDGTFTVTNWSTKQTADILTQIDKAIMDNKGKNCVGAAIKEVLTRRLGKGKTLEPLAAPGSSKAAFEPSIQTASGEFIKTVVIYGC